MENISLSVKHTGRTAYGCRMLVLMALQLSECAVSRAARANLALSDAMAFLEARRACRHQVRWPARVRSITEWTWHAGQVLNLSVTGVLLQLEQPCEIGDRVEVEIDFLAQPECKTVVTGVGYVVREHGGDPCRAAIHFDLDCRPGPRATAPVGHDARP